MSPRQLYLYAIQRNRKRGLRKISISIPSFILQDYFCQYLEAPKIPAILCTARYPEDTNRTWTSRQTIHRTKQIASSSLQWQSCFIVILVRRSTTKPSIQHIDPKSGHEIEPHDPNKVACCHKYHARQDLEI
jgi:hypothetical protein